MNVLLISGLAALLILWVIAKKREGKEKPAKKAELKMVRPSQTSSEYHAVSIRKGDRICEAVNKLTGQRILSKEAPMLPVEGCDIANCECSYVHYQDRRCGKDRRSPFNSGGLSATTGNFQVERRENRERRKEEDIHLF